MLIYGLEYMLAFPVLLEAKILLWPLAHLRSDLKLIVSSLFQRTLSSINYSKYLVALAFLKC